MCEHSRSCYNRVGLVCVVALVGWLVAISAIFRGW